jgi:hypothetical protein
MNFKTEIEARTFGDALLPKMPSPDRWTLRVWENLGWHCSVICGPIQVWPTEMDRYHCLISDDVRHAGGGAGVWSQRNGSAKTPKGAMRKAFAAVRAYQAQVSQVFNYLDQFTL